MQYRFAFANRERVVGDTSLTGRRILIVEDEMMVAMLLEDMLEDLGCEVVATAARAEHALSLIEEHSIDAAILDVNLDGQRSYAVADALAARGVTFLFATGYGSTVLEERFRERTVLQKPFRLNDLAAGLSAAIGTDGSPQAAVPGPQREEDS